MSRRQAVLVCVDGSKYADHALNEYLNFAHREGDLVLLGYVSEPVHAAYSFRPGLGVSVEDWNKMAADAEQRSVDVHHKYSRILSEKQIYHKFIHEAGHAGSQLCHLAEKEDVKLIVVGSRGQGVIRRTVLGSVSDHIVHHANVAVMICHQQE